VVLVGAIPGVTTTTKWDPKELIEALRKADRVMFPVSADVDVSPFAMVGYSGSHSKKPINLRELRRSGVSKHAIGYSVFYRATVSPSMIAVSASAV